MVDVRFQAPRSFTLLVDHLRGASRNLDAQTFETLYEEAAVWTMRAVQRHPGVGLVADERERIELALDTAVVLDDPTFGVHHHVVLQQRIEGRSDGEGGVQRAVDDLHMTLVRSVWGGYLRRLRELTSELGVVWGRALPGAPYEIVDPPLGEQAGERGAAGDCNCAARARIVLALPDSATVEREAREQGAVLIEAAQSGSSYWRPTPSD